jgi:hypothetical protein
VIDCETFHSSEIDALYGELDEEASAAMSAHAATCAECDARFARLKRTRGLVLAAAVEAVPADFESRIMAAVDAGMAKGGGAAVIPIHQGPHRAGSHAPAARKPEGGAKIVSLFSRPSFAVAATFVLVIGAGALILARSGTSLKSMAANDEAPGMAAAPAASGPGLTPVPVPAENAPAENAPAASFALGAATATAAVPAMAPPAAVAARPAAGAPAKAGKAEPSGEDARAFTAAKSLYNAGRYTDALPKFEALSAQNPEADLYAARCIARTRGCAAAEARYDTAAQTNAGTETGSRAQIEGARCYQSTGDVVAARRRYSAAKDEGLLEMEAAKALDDLDRSGGGSGTAGAAHAAPKSPAPAPRAPAATPPANDANR